MGTAIIVGVSAATGVYGAYASAEAQEDALNAAIGQEQSELASNDALNQELLDFYQQIYADSEIFREASWALLPTAVEAATAPASDTVSASYTNAAEEGLALLDSNLSVYGSAGSGPGAVAKGEFISDLSASEADSLTAQENTRTSNILSLLGLSTGTSTASTSAAASTLSSTEQTSSDNADLFSLEGAVEGGLYSSIGSSASQLGLLYGLGAFDYDTVTTDYSIPMVSTDY